MYQAIAPDSIGHPIAFPDSASLIADNGFKGVWFKFPRDTQLDAMQTREILDRYHLAAAGFGLPLDYLKDQATFGEGMKDFEQSVRYAQSIGLTRCMTWIKPASDTLTYRDNFAFHRSRLTEPARILAAYGISLGVEFLGPPKLRKQARYPFIHNLDQAMSLCYAIGTGNVGLILDIWHWDLAGQKRIDFDQIPDPSWVVAAHIMDAPAGVPADEQEDLDRRLPGATGVLDARHFFEGLQALAYPGPVIPEPFVPSLATLSFDQALKTVKKALDQVWPAIPADQSREDAS